MKKLPVKAARDVAHKYGLDQVILLCRDHENNMVHLVSYGRTKNDCGMAAMDGAKVQAMLNACPTSLDEAIQAAKVIRPTQVKKSVDETN